MRQNFEPAIKWSGSKRTQAFEIIKLFPNMNTFFEPFVGGASITYALHPSKAICGDICSPLIDLWEIIKRTPETLVQSYLENWLRLQNEGYLVYYEIRDRFNKSQNPFDLFFLSRTCVNGLIRFNRSGQFNNSLHHTRKGINPDRLFKIILEWQKRLENVQFVKGDYRETTSSVNKYDFVYLDPPYFNTRGRYYGTIGFEEFLTFLEDLNSKGIKYALSFDGKRKDRDYMVELPKDLYKRHLLMQSGNSSFKKVQDKSNEMVFESLYLNYE